MGGVVVAPHWIHTLKTLQNPLFSVPSGVNLYPRPTKNGARSTPSASAARKLTPLQPSTSPPFSSPMARSGTRGSRSSFRLFWATIISKPIGARKGASSPIGSFASAHPLTRTSVWILARLQKSEKNVARFFLSASSPARGILIDSLKMFAP